ncbi:MAG TPA: hypothetical protein VMD59_09260 [Acidimicrobiales bacterium]|nr:hypothetical protein [Acidimicrobiales bacterium]
MSLGSERQVPTEGSLRRGESPILRLAAPKVIAALHACFNFLALNLALLVACLPVLTLPVALDAAASTLERWRGEGEDRVVREFAAAFARSWSLRRALTVGTPLLATGLAAEEVHFFARGGSAGNWISLGFGVAALLVTASAVGYVLVLGVARPAAAPSEVWGLSLRIAAENVLLTGPLFLVELAVATLLVLLDPPLALLGVPLGLVGLLTLTARLGMRRSGIACRGGTPDTSRSGAADASRG